MSEPITTTIPPSADDEFCQVCGKFIDEPREDTHFPHEEDCHYQVGCDCDNITCADCCWECRAENE